MMAVFTTCVQTDFGKSLIRRYEGTTSETWFIGDMVKVHFFFTLPRLLDFENYYHYLVFGSIKINWVISQIMKGMSNYQDAVQIKCNRCAFSCLRTNYTDNFTYVTYV